MRVRSTWAGQPVITVLLGILVLVTSGRCGGESPTAPGGSTPSGQSTSSMSFRLDGTLITATSVTAGLSSGILAIGGGDASRNTTLSFGLTPTSTGTGTYTLAPLSAANAMILIGNPAAGWQAAVGIGSGTITINSLTSTGASGTFSFGLVAVGGTGATGTRTITEGVFNVTFTAVPAPPPTPNNGSTMSVSIGGTPWSSSLSRRATLTNNILTITGQDTNFRVITLAVPIGSGLLIPPSPATTISLDFTPAIHGTVTMVLGAQNWDNGHAGGAGIFTITGISATRVTGTFTVTLVSNPINVVPVPTVQLTSGVFDMALERF